ncbi:hypothetical protein [Chamaesiphon polymorphus]|uniref:Uncharacterized protein n=1 Tax=Chamaesiphon polymorphus CCALA 037 TaxID=2107692 RepID=A0A2T1G8F7_9CYAN|nr:hypothetical protein [Chamaesiphon polymorphus]PSB53473.1 hypothetical protein C7B77_19525 [Chamaesiphon polymorphus CCALA 037]
MDSQDNLDRNLLEAQEKSGIDLRQLQSDLIKIKQEFYPHSKMLSDTEMQYLCLSLARYSQGQIAYYFYKHKIPSAEELKTCEDLQRLTRNLNAEMSSRIHKYLKRLMNMKDNERKPSWKKIIDFLRQSERYKLPHTSTVITKLSVLIEIESFQSIDRNHIQQINELLKQHGIENIRISESI